MNVYKTEIFALPIPGTQGLVTELKDAPKFIVTNFEYRLIGVLSELTKYPVVEGTDVDWQQRNTDSCIFDLLTDDIDGIQANCDFSTRRASIKPRVVKLTNGVYVLSNHSGALAQCARERPIALTSADCVPCLLQLDPGCRLRVDGKLIVAEKITDETNQTSSSSVLHAVNLALIQEFYETENDNISAGRLFDPAELRSPQHIFSHYFQLTLLDCWRLIMKSATR
jgi:hypothetical protein